MIADCRLMIGLKGQRLDVSGQGKSRDQKVELQDGRLDGWGMHNLR